MTLGDILEDDADVPAQFFVSDDELAQVEVPQGRKSLTRISRSTGLEYTYDEGAIPFPDPTDTPSRTILTGEGGATPSRFKHIIQTEDGRYPAADAARTRATERLPGRLDARACPDGKRAFMMGNALVVGLVERVADELIDDDRGASRVAAERAAS